MNKMNYVGMLGIGFNTGTPWFMQDSTYANFIVNICFLCLTIIFWAFIISFHSF
jgi:hypothetical protein